MVSTIMAPALSTIALELDMNSAESVMALSIYLLATAFGPLLIGPLSEIYGRAPILHASNVWFLVWNIVCGFAKTKETLIAARFMAGFGASAIYALAGGVLGDIWRPEQRGKSLGVYLLIPLLGAAVGEITMSYVVLSTLLMLTVCRPDHRWFHGCTHDLAMVSSTVRSVRNMLES
jgi:MFS family permease